MYEFKLPDLGEGIQEGELLVWHVQEKDRIKEDDPLCDMETDKAAVTIPSPKTGVVYSLGAQPGDMVQVGQVLVTIETEESTETSTSKDDAPSSRVPDKEGRNQKGRNKKENNQDSQDVKAADTSADNQGSQARAIAAPAVRRLAREMDIDINEVPATGPGGRVTADDLLKYDTHGTDAGAGTKGTAKKPEKTAESVESRPAASDAGTKNDMVPASGIPFLTLTPLPDFAAQGPVEKIPMRSVRKKTAARTVTSSILVPHVAHMEEADVTELETLRRAYNDKTDGPHAIDDTKEHSGHLTLMAFVIKAVAALLKKYPAFNASVDTDSMQIIHKKFFHIGFAADTPRGLLVPVIQDADQHSLAALGMRIRHLAQQAKKGEIQVENLTGGTFSVTNVGAIGGTHVLPIINYPESAILGMGRVAKKPVVKDDAVQIRQMLPLTLCFDHRVADGAQAARFVRDLVEMLEDPMVFMAHI
ncbi:MAG: dihydrolipoamide acetyltransferase family protein [Desulfotignum sp.]|jgi:pyruvate dehydrogenase E2 component (dihydrolipoamide acetyltransferase)|nr:dihydrolipoamide acetyltransferase family protein [Desulfotignum sp.]